MSARDDYPPAGLTVRQSEQWGRMCDEIDRQRDTIDAVAELLVGGPIWGLLPEAYSCRADLVHQEWLADFCRDLQVILHPLRPDMVAAPDAPRATA